MSGKVKQNNSSRQILYSSNRRVTGQRALLLDLIRKSKTHLDADSPESRLLGCKITECPEKVKIANPITYITKDDPAFLIIHGTYDCVVTPKSSILLKEKLDEMGVDAELHLIPHAGHGGKEFYTPEMKAIVLDFIERKLQ